MENKFTEIGRIVHELKPSMGNPRNSEGAFIKLKGKKIMFAYSKFIGSTFDDDDKACIAAIFSEDNGETWGDERLLVAPEEHDAQNIMSVSLVRMGNGDIGLFYLIRYGWDDTRICVRRSFNEGRTWGAPSYCTAVKGYYETNNDRVIKLSSGRIIIPSAHYRIPWKNKANFRSAFRGTAMFFISDDDGHTWRESLQVCAMPIPRSSSGLQETGTVELDSNFLWAWFRTDMGYQYESYSRDGGDAWTMPQPSVFASGNSPMSVKKKDNMMVVVWNPKQDATQRDYFAIAASEDKGILWRNVKYLENPVHDRGYCYTAMHFTEDDCILLAYCAGEFSKGHSCLEETRIRKIELGYFRRKDVV